MNECANKHPIHYIWFVETKVCKVILCYTAELMSTAMPILSAILEQESKGWFVPFREKCISERKGHGVADEEIERVCQVHCSL